VLVNNAGTAIPKTFKETTLEEMDRLIDVNVRGVFVATQAALKHMKRDGGLARYRSPAQDQRREVAGETDSRRLTDALAGARDDGN
jgi:NAD(P)-dependent dehydrogenase (short-subunit alcohol dehydrogenase family)